MKDKYVIKSVAFSAGDPDQMELLKHAGQRSNFSGYIKRLIQRDMEGVSHKPQKIKPLVNEEFMKGLI